MQENNTVVADFIARHGLSYPFLLDLDGSISRDYDVYTTPTTYFVKPDGAIAGILPGVVSQRWLDRQMEAIQG